MCQCLWIVQSIFSDPQSVVKEIGESSTVHPL